MKNLKKASKNSKKKARYQTIESARDCMNYWRKDYAYWKEVLGDANRGMAFTNKSDVMKALNTSRGCLRTYMGVVEIKLGIAA